MTRRRFNPAPGWPSPPPGWEPPADWRPDPTWPQPPYGWPLWIDEGTVPDETPRPYGIVGDQTPPSEDASEVDRLKKTIARMEVELADLRALATTAGLDDQRALLEVGIYQYHHPLANAVAFRDRLDTLQAEIRDAVRNGRAIFASDMFTYNNSLAKGRRMVSDFGKLMLRAYNAEADNCIRSLRAGSAAVAKNRLNGVVDTVAKLGSMMAMRINPAYHELRITEIELTSDFLMRVQHEREIAREERERLREERRAEEELAAERARLDKERAHYANALDALRARGDQLGAAEAAAKLADIDAAIAQNDYRLANIRAGYVYVISNIGAFGPNVIKIGLTRRLDPTDRISELSGAAVPFRYDIHALVFSDDAVSLEADLHRRFAHRRVNGVNQRREFFFATPTEVKDALSSKLGTLLEYIDTAEALEYRQSAPTWPDHVRRHD